MKFFLVLSIVLVSLGHITSDTGMKEVQFYVFSDLYNHVKGPTHEEEGLAVKASEGHKLWTASIPGATWIWDSEVVSEPGSQQTAYFKNFFAVEGKTQRAILDIAADDSVWVKINGKKTECFRQTSSYTAESQFQCDVTKYIEVDLNRIEFKVVNKPAEKENEANPAGLLYRLSINTLV
jgi:uncharacterized membrane-anchored protein